MDFEMQEAGSQQPNTQPQQHPSYSQPNAPTPPGAPRDIGWTKILLIIAIIVVVFVVIFLLLSFLLVSGTMCGGSPDGPNIDLRVDEVTGTTGEWKIEVIGASRSESLDGYDVLMLNGTSVAVQATSLNELSQSCSGSPGLSFTDVAQDGRLNQGDWFVVCGTDTTSDYLIQIYWIGSNGEVSGSTGRIIQ
jgi:hypothetical protein